MSPKKGLPAVKGRFYPMNITLKDGSLLALENGASAGEAAQAISAGLARAALAAKINGEVAELSAVLKDGDTLEILTGADADGLRVLRHSVSHVMAQAIKRLVVSGNRTESGLF